MARLTKADKAWLAKHYPGLNCVERPKFSLVEGRLDFRRSHEEGVDIADSYQIRLELPESKTALPRLTETGGRLERVLQKHPEFDNRWVELHVYPSKRLCLAAPQELKLRYLPKPSARRLFEDYIVPYFYSQSYFEENDDWPWDHLPHDSFGVVAWYLGNSEMAGAAGETIKTLKELAEGGQGKAQRIVERAMKHDSFNPRSKCLCGSGRSFIQCGNHAVLIKLALAFRNSQPSA